MGAWLIEWAVSLGAGHGEGGAGRGGACSCLACCTVRFHPSRQLASLSLRGRLRAIGAGGEASPRAAAVRNPVVISLLTCFIPTANGHYNLVTFFFIIGCLTLISRLWAYLAFFPKDALLRSGWVPLLFGAVP